jgi:hypothetical protein
MAFRAHSTIASSRSLADMIVSLYPNWSERIVIVAAASAAVLIVATIAVLMGMA